MTIPVFASSAIHDPLRDGDYGNGELVNGSILYERPDPSPNEYIDFTPGLSRISSNGDFHYCVRLELHSDEFMATKSTINLTAFANICTYDGDLISSTSSHEYSFGIYPTSFWGSGGGEFTTTTNTHVDHTFNVTVGENYQMIITNIDYCDYGEYVYGDGNLSNISVL